MSAYEELVKRCVALEITTRGDPEATVREIMSEVHRTLDQYLSAPVSVSAFLAILAPDNPPSCGRGVEVEVLPNGLPSTRPK